MELTYSVIYITVIIAALLQTPAYCNDVTQGVDVQEMRSMLRDAMAVNRKLELQNKRLMKMWSGLEHLCSSMNGSPGDIHGLEEDATTLTFKQKVPLSNIAIRPDSKQKTAKEQFENLSTKTPVKDVDIPLQILSVQSSGDGVLNLTVKYTAPEQHSTDWYAKMENNGQFRSAGNRRYHSGVVYTVQEAFYEPELLRYLHFQMNAGEKNVQLLINLDAVKDVGEQTLPTYPDITFSQAQYAASEDADLDVIVTLPQPVTPDILVASSFVFFVGVNTTTYPLQEFKYSNFDSDVMTVTGISSNGKTVVNVTINKELAQHGGKLIVRQPGIEDVGGYVLRLHYNQYVTITSQKNGDVIERNNVALHPWDPETVIAGRSYSLWCSATGNPTPEVKILRQLRNGKTKEKKTQAVITDRYNTIVSLTLSSNDKRKGLYICSATSGNHTVEETTEVTFFQPLTFYTKASRVIKNNSVEVNVKCRASGRPRPDLEFRLDDPDGPGLSNWTDNYGVTVGMTSKSTTLFATIAQPLDTWPTIFCVGNQRGFEQNHSFQIFPRIDLTHKTKLTLKSDESING